MTLKIDTSINSTVDTGNIELVSSYLDITKNGVPPFNDTDIDKGMSFSSTLSILRGIKKAINDGIKSYVDNSIQVCVLSVGSDLETDFIQFRKATTSNRLILPSLAISYKTDSTMYSTPGNYRRYEQVIFDGTRYGVSFLAIPVAFELTLRYYCRNMDALIRFRDNLRNNSQLAFPKDGFSYKVFDDNEDIYINGTIYISQKTKEWEMKFSNIDGESGVDQYYSMSIPLTCFANAISQAYKTPIIFSVPKINIKIN